MVKNGPDLVDPNRPEEPDREARYTARWTFITPRGAALVAVVHQRLSGVIEMPRQARAGEKLAKALTALLAELGRSLLTGEDGRIFAPRSNRVLEATTRYDPPGLNVFLPRVLDGLAALKIIDQTLGRIEPDGTRLQTVVQPMLMFKALLTEREITLDDIGEDLDVETILLKSAKDDRGRRRLLPYADDPNTDRMRHQMTRINTAIACADITAGAFIVSDRLLRRHFSETFGRGGRLYTAGGWQRMSGEERREILIDSAEVVELDYAAAGLRILYGLAGAVPPAGDLYQLPELPRASRDDVKTFVAALMFIDQADLMSLAPVAKRIRPDIAARVGQDSDDFEKFMTNKAAVEAVLDAVRRHHAPVAAYLLSILGHQVQKIEADVMVRALLDLIGQGVVALPIHDGLVVRQDQADLAKAAMQEAFAAVAGVDAEIKVKTGA